MEIHHGKRKKKFEMEMRMEVLFVDLRETVRRIHDAVFLTTGIFHRFSFATPFYVRCVNYYSCVYVTD